MKLETWLVEITDNNRRSQEVDFHFLNCNKHLFWNDDIILARLENMLKVWSILVSCTTQKLILDTPYWSGPVCLQELSGEASSDWLLLDILHCDWLRTDSSDWPAHCLHSVVCEAGCSNTVVCPAAPLVTTPRHSDLAGISGTGRHRGHRCLPYLCIKPT